MFSKHSKKGYYIFLLLFSLFVFRFLFTPFFWHFHDEMQPFWFYEWFRSFKLGLMPIRWAPDLVWGAGYPLFTFIYPIPYYIGGFFYSLGLSLATSFKLYIILVSFLSLFFFNLTLFLFIQPQKVIDYLFLIATNLIFISFPYRAVDIYVRGAIGELTFYASLSFWFWSFFSYLKSSKKIYFYLLALAYALIILSHNIGAYFFIPFLGLLNLIFAFSRFYSWKRRLSFIFLPFLLGLGLSAFFWLPALIQKPLMTDSPIFNIKDHFPFIKQLIWSRWGYGSSHWGPNDDLSFQLGPASWLALVLALFFFNHQLLKKKVKFLTAFWLFFSLFVFYLLNIRSLWLWQTIPLLNYFQFPWRLLLALNFTIPLFFFFSLLSVSKVRKYLRYFIYLSIIFLAFYQSWAFFRPQKLVRLDNDYFFARYLPNGRLYRFNSEEYLRLPKGCRRLSEQPPLIEVSKNNKIKILKTSFKHLVFQSYLSHPELITLRRLYFPSWQIRDNHRIIKYQASKNGLVQFKLSSGQHRVEVSLKQTPVEKLANGISLLSLIIFLWFGLSSLKLVKTFKVLD